MNKFKEVFSWRTQYERKMGVTGLHLIYGLQVQIHNLRSMSTTIQKMQIYNLLG